MERAGGLVEWASASRRWPALPTVKPNARYAAAPARSPHRPGGIFFLPDHDVCQIDLRQEFASFVHPS